MVRQLQPGAEGIPLEIYCFTGTTDWLEYERIQSDLFDYLLALLPEFDLALYQQPAGNDLRQGLQALAHRLPSQAHAAQSPGTSERPPSAAL